MGHKDLWDFSGRDRERHHAGFPKSSDFWPRQYAARNQRPKFPLKMWRKLYSTTVKAKCIRGAAHNTRYTGSSSIGKRAEKQLLCIHFRGVERIQDRVILRKPDIQTSMISDAIELVAAVVNDLPSDLRTVVAAHFFEDESVFKIQRQRKMKRRDLETMIEIALGTMRMALRGRGVRGVSDVI